MKRNADADDGADDAADAADDAADDAAAAAAAADDDDDDDDDDVLKEEGGGGLFGKGWLLGWALINKATPLGECFEERVRSFSPFFYGNQVALFIQGNDIPRYDLEGFQN